MSSIGRRRWLIGLTAGLLVGAGAVFLWPRSSPPVIPQASPEVLARFKLQGALRDASLSDLIQNARVAARKGDDKTHRAMVSGLKREPQRARTLIQGEIAKATDTTDLSILNRMITELP